MSAVEAPRTAVGAEAALATPRNVWPIMTGVLLAVLLGHLDQTIVGTAMPRVVAQLNGFSQYAWVATAYLVTSTVTVPIYGKLSDLLGRKRVFIFGVVLFLIGSVLCGAAQTMTQLIGFRALQGCGAGALLPVALAIVGDLFPPKERGKWQGVTGSAWAFAALVGPLLGGFITDNLSWRWIFYVNVPIGLAALAVLMVAMPPLRRDGQRAHIDTLGALALVVSVAPLLLAFTWAGSSYAWDSPQVVGLLAGAAVLLALFVIYELRAPEPILTPRLFASRAFSVSVVAASMIQALLLGAILFVPLFIQGVVGASATSSGAVLTPMIVTAIVGALLSGQLLSRFGRYYYIAVGGFVLTLLGMALTLGFDVHTRLPSMIPALLLLGTGMGIGAILYNIVVQNAFPNARLGEVSSALAFFRAIGGTLGVAALGSLMTGRYTADLRAALPSAVAARVPLAGRQALANPQMLLRADVQAAIQHAFARLGPSGAPLYAVLVHAIHAALANALHTGFIALLAITLIGFVAVIFLPELPLRGAEPAGPETLARDVEAAALPA